jgi:hypothetical protein
MSVDQVSDLIGRATFDEEKKKSFVTELRSGLFEEHKSFLSNPLLAIIMLITFDVSSSVPKKLSLFYSYAYEALFYKHDSSKGVYIREHFTTLGIDEFERVFRAFSFVTFSLGKFRFDLSELTSLMRESLDACGLREVRPEDYILDCQQSLCLLQEDGLEYIFVHRSFQEYFSARYLLFFVGTDYYDFVNGLADRFHTDSVIDMLYEMDPDSCQRRWILPRLEMEVSDLWYIEKTDYTNLAKFLRTYANAITVDMQNGIIKYHTWSSGDRAGTYILISKILQGEFGFKDMLLSGRVGGESFSLDALLRKAKSGLNKEVYDEMNSSISINNDNDAQILFSESLCNWMSVTDLPSLLRELGARLIEVRNELTKKLAKRDEFTAKVSSILRRGH